MIFEEVHVDILIGFALEHPVMFGTVWLAVGLLAFLLTTSILLRSDDFKLGRRRAWMLAAIGLLDSVPLAWNLIPFKWWFDFKTRWLVLRIGTFRSYEARVLVACLILGPIVFILAAGLSAFGYCDESAFAHDVRQRGFVRAIRLRYNI